jgi:beta-glucosidase
MAALGPVENLDLGQDIDPNASPVGSIDTNTTPDTEFSPPDSPILQNGPPKDKRALARTKLATLTTEEKVRPHAATPFRGRGELTCSRCPS